MEINMDLTTEVALTINDAIRWIYLDSEDPSASSEFFILNKMLEKTSLENTNVYIIKQIPYLHLIIVAEDHSKRTVGFIKIHVVKPRSHPDGCYMYISVENGEDEFLQWEIQEFKELQTALSVWGYN
jgi:hypothetical protein